MFLMLYLMLPIVNGRRWATKGLKDAAGPVAAGAHIV